MWKTLKTVSRGMPLISIVAAILCQTAILYCLGAWFSENTQEHTKILKIKLVKTIPASIVKIEPQITTVPPEKILTPAPPKKIQPVEIKQPAVPLPRPILKKVTAKPDKKKIKVVQKAPQKKIPAKIKPQPAPEKVVTLPERKPRNTILTTGNQPENVVNEPIPALGTVSKPDEKEISNYLRKIARLLEKRKQYPERARRRGVEGRVLILFNVNSDGKVINAEIRSKSNSMLAKATLDLVKTTAFPKPPKNWNQEFRIEIPINYKFR